MSWFNFLFGGQRSNVEQAIDQVWMTNRAKLSGIKAEAAARDASDSSAMLLVAHFPDCLEQIRQTLEDHEFQTPFMSVLARDLANSATNRLMESESVTIDLIVGERHPRASADDKLMAFLEQLPCRCRMVHHLSLEDPVLAVFVNDWLQSLLERMGVREDEAIQNAMIGKRIRGVQQKIEEQAISDLDAASARQWIEVNCPKMA